MEVSLIAVVAAAVMQFAVGAIWYMPLFGKMWGEMFGFDKLSKKEQDKAQKEMMPWMGVQFLITVLTSYVLAWSIANVTTVSVYTLVFLIWIGFFVPTQASAVIFGGTEAQWIKRRILIMAGGSLACLVAGAFVINLIQK
jgi:Protein of unknown function (DUF1761)